MLSFFGVMQHNVDADWPREIQTDKGKIIIYQPQPEKLTGNLLEARAAISIEGTDGKQPSFGAMWFKAQMNTDRGTRTAVLENIDVTNLRFPAITDSSRKEDLIDMIETEVLKWQMQINLDDVVTTLEQNSSDNLPSFNNKAPEIVVTEKPSLLVVLDGSAKMVDYNKQFSKVANTPYFLVKDKDGGQYYLYTQSNWYTSGNLMTGWSKVDKPSKDLRKIEDDIKKTQQKNKADNNTAGNNDNYYNDQNTATGDLQIIVKDHPSELISSNGKPNFVPIQNTSLLYMDNSNADVFMNIDNNQYYTVLSGRWYKAPSTSGPWNYIDANQLPKDFANIPQGSAKDNVLAYVPGTDASRDALLDNQIPQTASVDRSSAKASDVTYDGSPSFKPVEGTNLQYAQNTSSTVFRSGNTYYLCDNAVWFQSSSPSGPWTVSTTRPPEIDNISPSNPNYNTKYVYIYDVTPSTVYTGYTPGYLGAYSYGPTVVYGTGWYYPGWYGAYYYPRPVTWGFGFNYNPWTGWGFSFGFNYGWYDPWYSFGYCYGGYGGWWGPPVYHPYYYRPAYYYGGGGFYGKPYYRPTGYYGRPNNVVVNNNVIINNRNSRNVYSYHTNGVTTRPAASRGVARDVNNVITTRPQRYDGSTSTGNVRPAAVSPNGSGNVNRPNNVYTDRQGNVYRRNNNNWEVRDGNSWRPESTQSPSSVGNNGNVGNSRPAGTYNNNNANRPATQPDYSNRPQNVPQQQTQQQPSATRPYPTQQSQSRPDMQQRPADVQRPQQTQQPSYRPAQGTMDRSSYDRQRGAERSMNFQQSQQPRSFGGGSGGGYSRPSGGGGNSGGGGSSRPSGGGGGGSSRPHR